MLGQVEKCYSVFRKPRLLSSDVAVSTPLLYEAGVSGHLRGYAQGVKATSVSQLGEQWMAPQITQSLSEQGDHLDALKLRRNFHTVDGK